MSLDKDTVRNVAYLARIEVPEEHLEHLAGDLSRILEFVEKLGEVDTEGVEPMASVADLALPERDDVVTEGEQPEKVLANAPEAREGFFLVPKVVE